MIIAHAFPLLRQYLYKYIRINIKYLLISPDYGATELVVALHYTIASTVYERRSAMVRGYIISDAGEGRELLGEETLPDIEPEPFKDLVSNATPTLPPPSPLRPSLRLSRSSSINFERSPSRRSFLSTSSLNVPSLTSATSSPRSLQNDNSSWDGAESSILDESDSSETELEDTDNYISKAIPPPCRGVHFHARRKHFVIIPPPKSCVHRVVSVQFQGDKVREISSRKPFGANTSFSQDDISLSAKGADHIAIVRRSSKSSKIFVTVHRRGEHIIFSSARKAQ